MSLTILHTNDLHGHVTGWRGWEGPFAGKTIGGAAYLASAIQRERAKSSDAVLLLDAGDLIGDTMIADLTEGQALIELFNHLHYDAMTFGNHEPDFGVAALKKRVTEARFPFLAANLTQDNGQPFVDPFMLKTVGGVAVGILGLTYPKTPRTTAWNNVKELRFQEAQTAATQQIPKMRRAGAEVIVVLSHLGLGADQRLAKHVEGIDVIVGGHSHNRMEQAEQVNNTLIVQAGAHGSDLGRLELTVVNGMITAHNHSLVVLDHAVLPPDGATEQLVAKLLRPFAAQLNEQIGTAADWIVRAQTIAGQGARKRDEESPADSLFADILREEFRADIGFLPGVGYGVAIPPGPITAAQLRQLVPHAGNAVTMQLTGAEVVQILEQAAENVFTEDPNAKVGGMIQISGIRFRCDPANPHGARITKIEFSNGDWNSEGSYSVVTTSMLAQGGHNQKIFSRGQRSVEHGSQYDTIQKWMTKHSPVTAPPPGRIRFIRERLTQEAK